MALRGITLDHIKEMLQGHFRVVKVEPATGWGIKYTVFSDEPLKDKGQHYGAVIIPSMTSPEVFVVTVMLEDEDETC